MTRPWTAGHQVLALATMIPVGSLLVMPLRVTPSLVGLLNTPPEGWTSLTLSWWLPPLLSLPAIVGLASALTVATSASRRNRLLLALAAGWTALTAILAGVVVVLVA